MKQPQVARLELGEHNPSIETLLVLTRKLGLRFAFAIGPAGESLPIRPRKTDIVDLAEGGRIKMPLTEQPWGADVGWLTDKFGMNWMVNIDKA